MNKKILLFIPSIEEGGVEKNLYIVSNYLIKKKLRLEILTCNFNKKKFLNKKIKIIGPKNNFLINKSRFIKNIVCLIFLFLYLLKNSTNTIVFAFQANLYAILLSKLTMTKVITRSNSSPSGWSKNPIKKILYKIVINLADDVMVNSIKFKNEIYQHFNVKAKCIFNPFDKQYFYKNIFNKKKDFFKKKRSLKILSIGRLTNQKDHLTLLRSINLIDKKLNPEVIIIGKGENYSILNNYINENHLNKFVKLVGYKNNPSYFMKKADIFVLTSLYEGLPNVLLEAQYFKKYIISTDCPTGPREILLNWKAGDLIKIGDYKNLGNLINKFFIRKKIISRKIKLGSKYFSRYDYYDNCEKYYKFIIQNV